MGIKFYSFGEINEVADCRKVATDFLKLELDNSGRCAATWRGGTNRTSVQINEKYWHDFKTKSGGTVVDLVALVKFEGNLQLAQNMLGEYLGLTPTHGVTSKVPEANSRYDRLIEEGYRETDRYQYTDQIGTPVHFAVRLEHPTKPKQFLQGTEKGWGLGDVQPVLYNLPGIIESPFIFVVEGEKDADNLIRLGLPATTNAGGCKKWREEYIPYFKDKEVIILYDNDLTIPKGQSEPVGIAHAKMIAKSIFDCANCVCMIRTSTEDKGDVSDWLAEGNGRHELMELVRNSPLLTAEDLKDVEPPKVKNKAIEEAKHANRREFRNFYFVKSVDESTGKTVNKKKPRHINDMIKECKKRFLGFPRKVGEQLFDHDRETDRIEYFYNHPKLFAWISQKSGQIVSWARGDSYVSREMFYEGLQAVAKRYEAISSVPDWPIREDVYYSHAPLPPPDPEHKYFETFCNFFNPISPEFKIGLKAFVASPLFYKPEIDAPLWIIDSEKAGCGKTKLANSVSSFYGMPPIEVKKSELKKNMQDITKRLVSSQGRQSRMFLIDNVTGDFKSDELSSLITMPHISGKPPYGRGEETRPNNLTYVITANNTKIDNDLTIRAYFIKLGVIAYDANWNTSRQKFVKEHQLNIFADILDILNNHDPSQFEAVPETRCPEFETEVLQAFCKDMEEYRSVLRTLMSTREEANIEDDHGQTAEEEIRHQLVELGINPLEETVWIRSNVLEDWMRLVFPNRRSGHVQFIKNMARNGHCPNLDISRAKFPGTGHYKGRGVT